MLAGNGESGAGRGLARGMSAPCRVLVTGVSGFVGGALGRHLRERGGYRVTGVSRSAPRAGAVDAFVAHDLSRPLPAGCEGHEVIVHCAALAAPWGSPKSYRRHNVDATRNVLDLAARSGVRKLVFISSSSVYYRHGDQLGIREETPLPAVPINEYAASKLAAEQLVMASPVPSVVLRPRAVFGPGDTVLFPRILRAARRGVLPRFVRPDGVSPLGDLIYVDNLAHFIERAIATPCAGAFNLTNGEPVDLNDFLAEIFRELGLPPVKRTLRVGTAFALARVLEAVSRWLLAYREPPITRYGVEVMAYSKTFDVAKATAAFGAAPLSNTEGLARFVAWQREQPA